MMKDVIRGNKVFIIAEAGVNHNGRLGMAKKLVDAAKKAGCDAVKFQTFKAEQLLSKKAKAAGYQKRNIRKTIKSQYDLIKGLELTFEEFSKLKDYCDRKGILFISSPFDYESVDFLARLNLPVIKIPSGEITNLPFLKYVAKKRKWIILSTGMATLKEVKEAVSTIKGAGNSKLVLLHCVTDYPASAKDMNLKAMEALSIAFNVPVGFSDHSMGTEISVAAAALGARIIEKHITLDRSLSGPDHKASLEPDEFKRMVTAIRNVELALGDGIKRPAKSESKYRPLVRKSIVAKQDIIKGETISEDDIVIKRPGHGIAPKDIDRVIGRKLRISVKKDDVLNWTQVI